MPADLVNEERQRRQNMWTSLTAENGPRGVSPALLRDLGIYGGAQGIWTDKIRTSSITPDGVGVTVGVLHTGEHYPDDLSDDAIIYHYPSTHRPGGRDIGEINATKNAGKLGLPVFVVTSSSSPNKRDVFLGRVEKWDDETQQFLISFASNISKVEPTTPDLDAEDEAPFRAFETTSPVHRMVTGRPGQVRFKFNVIKRYGPKCAVCDLDISELLEAAHVIPKKKRGSDDPGNGLVLCANHHRAWDMGLFGIEPTTV